MNVTELARKLKITPNKLREVMPQLGFDIGVRAIKVDPKMAQAVFEKLSNAKIREEYLGEKTVVTKKKFVIEGEDEEKEEYLKLIEIPEKIVVKELAKRMEVPVANLMMELMKNGVMASLNQFIDYDTASIIVEDMGFKPEKSGEEEGGINKNIDYVSVLGVTAETATPRPPVVVVMGHVDHGKTKLLDAIRETNIVDSEAGGITQHIGAYQVNKNGRLLTFIDTPGHEAFSAMRSRGAQVADIAILLVAADDGVQPQTVEAVAHIKNAGLPFIVAINKIDKPGANLDKVKSDLANINLNPEDWGGDTICVPVSAKEGTNISGLLETLFLVADMEKEKLIANNDVPAIGTIIESHVDKGEGPVATVLVQTGTLRKNDFMEIGGAPGKARGMRTWKGELVDEALPSMPVKILGLKSVPQVGDILRVIKDKKVIKKLSRVRVDQKNRVVETEQVVSKSSDEENKMIPRVNLIIKADVFGSIEAILESLEKIKHPTAEVKIIKQGLGNLTEKDVEQAKDLGAELVGFNVKVTTEAKKIAVVKDVELYLYNVIYDLLDMVEGKVKERAGTHIVRTKKGEAKVLKIFKSTKTGQIVGAKAVLGKIEPNMVAVVKRQNEEVGEIKLIGLQSGKEDVSEVVEGQEFGIQTEGKTELRDGDMIMVYSEEEKEVA